MTAELAAKVVKQIEYYFSDINLCRDAHLKDLISKSTNGFVSFESLFKFPRLAALSTDPAFIASSLTDSKSELVEVNEDKDGVKRCDSAGEIPADFDALLEQYKEQTLYIKGFPRDSSIDSIIEYCEKFGGPTYNVHMRRFPRTKEFKGSIFVIFKDKNDAEKLNKNKDEVEKVGEDEMIIRWSKDYREEKLKMLEGKIKDKKQQKEKETIAFEDEIEKRMVKGSLIELDGLKKFEKVEDFDEKTETMALRAFIDERIKDIASVLYVDYFYDTGKAIIRLNKPDCAQAVKDKLYENKEESFEYNEAKITVEVMTGEPEKAYWKTVITKLNSRQNNKKRSNRNGGPPNKRRRN